MKMTRERFIALWNRCLLDGVVAEAVPIYEELAQRYAEPHRRYHTRNHISHCLQQLDLATGLMDCPDAVEMGLWFHDAIYDPRASDNELRSAELFTDIVNDRVAPNFRQTVYDLILITTHPEHPERLDEKFIVDIDLSSFALPWEAFKRDSNAVRQEYSHLPDKEFYPGQLEFLQALLERPIFFFTDFFRSRYENVARQNITRYIEELHAQGYG